MELTIDQALHQGVAAHKEGKLLDAERFYRAILQVQPNQPDANHNLGVLIMAVGKTLEAIPMFKLALEANPQVEQFWLSYLDALIKAECLDQARRMLVEGKKYGLSSDKLDALKQRLTGSVAKDTNKTAKGQALSGKEKVLAERKQSKRSKELGYSPCPSPSEDQINSLIRHYKAGRWAEAEPLAVSLTQQFPKDPFAWKVLGALLTLAGRINESLSPMQESLKLSPEDAEARYNFGVALQNLGRLDEAEASYRQAIALKPDYAEALNNLGNTLQELGRSDEAGATIRQAIALKPDYAEAHNNLGAVLHELMRFGEAEACYREAIALKPDFAEAHRNLGNALKELGRLVEAEASYKHAVFLKPDDGHAAHMLSALTGSNPRHAPLDYVEDLFDGYATKFDSSLVDQLGYRTPKVIAKLITQNSGGPNIGSVLDLGCGTGLFGSEIFRLCDRLEGVDISMNMLRKAKEKGVYTKLVKRDIQSYLLNETLNFDFYVATDVFVYIGELAEVFRLIQSRNESKGRLVFSVEHKDGLGFALRPSGRYAHSKTYIEGLCEKFRYRLRYFEIQDIRLEGGKYIQGGLYLLTF
jgi:predicted TPR repeat methyltransferase